MADMINFRAAFDPIFWSHHANVDRLWAKWQGTLGKDGPINPTAALPGLDTRRTVAEVLDIGSNRLAYEYVEDSIAVRSDRSPLGPREPHVAAIGRAKPNIGRAELRLEAIHALDGSPAPCAVDVLIPGQSSTPRVSLFGMQMMSNGSDYPGMKMMMSASLSWRVDLTAAVLSAMPQGELELELRLVLPRGVPEDICRLGISSVDLVLFPN